MNFRNDNDTGRIGHQVQYGSSNGKYYLVLQSVKVKYLYTEYIS